MSRKGFREKPLLTAITGAGVIDATIYSIWRNDRNIDDSQQRRSATVDQYSERHQVTAVTLKEPLSHRWADVTLNASLEISLLGSNPFA